MSKTVPAYLKALGRRELPAQIEACGQTYHKQRVFKNDFFAVTALYEGDAGRVLVKVGRQASFLLIPMQWIGKLLTAREASALTRLDDVAGIPKLLTRWGPTGLVRDFVEGHALAKGERVSDDFHPKLKQLVHQIHQRGMAYVDLEKCENVLVGDDGQPHLFDFQIAWMWPRKWGGDLWPIRGLRSWFQRSDLYHLEKLRRRTRPDQMTPQELKASYAKPWYVRGHRLIAWPFTWLRRKVLNRIDPRRRPGERGRVYDNS